MKNILWIIFFISLQVFAADSDMITKVITLNYISGEKAEQVLKPLIKPDESISHSDQKLVVSVSEKTLTKIRTVLQRLDVMPVVFNIYVHQDDADWLNRQRQSTISYSTSSNRTRADNQMVQVLNGKSALVSTGTNVPVVSSVSFGLWGTGVSYDRLSVNQGFLIQPTLRGSRVELKIRRFNAQQDNANQQNIHQNYTDTTTIVPEKKWVKLGSAGHADLDDGPTSVSYEAGNSFRDKQTVYVKVQVVKTKPEKSGRMK